MGVSTRPGHLLYIYHHIYDENLPDLARMQALAMLGAHLIRTGRRCWRTAAWASTGRPCWPG